jgi:hypothetical protein
VYCPNSRAVITGIALLPYDGRDEALSAEDVVEDTAKPVLLGVITMHPDGTSWGKEVLNL